MFETLIGSIKMHENYMLTHTHMYKCKLAVVGFFRFAFVLFARHK